MTVTEARKEIASIDRQIDANRAGINDRALEVTLFQQRGAAQLRRDDADEALRMAAARSARLARRKKCPTCGHRTLEAA